MKSAEKRSTVALLLNTISKRSAPKFWTRFKSGGATRVHAIALNTLTLVAPFGTWLKKSQWPKLRRGHHYDWDCAGCAWPNQVLLPPVSSSATASSRAWISFSSCEVLAVLLRFRTSGGGGCVGLFAQCWLTGTCGVWEASGSPKHSVSVQEVSALKGLLSGSSSK